MIGILKKVMNSNERDLKRLYKFVNQINAMEPTIKALSDEQLQAKTGEFRERLEKGATLDSILVEAFAVVREASWRVSGKRPFDVQLIGGIVLHEGRVAEMKTGEGKTLVAALPSYLNALTGKGVHVITVNEYLARLAAESIGQIHNFLGLSVGLNLAGMEGPAKQEAYGCDITYGTNSEFGFDYLRDNMVRSLDQLVQRNLNFAIVDEVDSILIDEARTPHIFSAPAEESTEMYFKGDMLARMLKEEDDFTVDVKMNAVNLTEQGVHKAERYFGIANLFDPAHLEVNHHVQVALKAHTLFKRDQQYIVQNDEIIIVDEFTGRLMYGRRFNEGIHQAIEAKEGVRVQNESKTIATVTLQNYFRMYPKLSGMTGTAKTEEEEFRSIYGLDVVVIPTNMPMIRKDLSDVIYKNERGKFNAVVEEIAVRHEKGQPVLVGTVSIEKSEMLSSLLRQKRILHQVLNAKHHEREAEIIALSGQRSAVTIATNMAGRGTDIILGEGIAELGGLHVIGTERHESRRIDNQLRGRSGRQGDPGSSQFYLSLEDELMRRFGSENIMGLMDRLGLEEDQPIENRFVTRAIESAQKKVEGNMFDLRKHVLRYDDVMNQQREIIYKQRREILELDHLADIVKGMIKDLIDFSTQVYCTADQVPEEWDIKALLEYNENHWLTHGRLTEDDLRGKEREEIGETFYGLIDVEYETRAALLGPAMTDLEKEVLIRTVDGKWTDHIDSMEHLRQGIHLRAYAQRDPLVEYRMEGFEMFEAMINSIREEVALYVFKAPIVSEQPEQLLNR